MTLTAQNFHIYTSGNLRFVVTLNSDSLINELTTSDRAFFRISLGERIVAGQQMVRNIFAKPESFIATDSVDLTTRETTRRSDGQFELIALSTDFASGTRRLEFSGAGIYPVQIEVIVNEIARAKLLGFVNRYDASRVLKPMPVNTLIALDSPITLQPDSSHLVGNSTREKLVKIIKLLKLNASKITLQISPELITGLSKSTDPIDQSLLVQLLAALGSAPNVRTTYIQFDPTAASSNNQSEQFVSLLGRGSETLNKILPNTKMINNVWISRNPLDQKGLDLLVQSGVRSVVMLPQSSRSLGEFDNAARPYRLKNNQIDVSLHLVDKTYVEQLSTPNNNSFLSATYLAAQILAQRDQIEREGGTPALRRVVLTSRDGSVVNEDLIHETLLILGRVPQQIALRTMANLPAPRLDAYEPILPTVNIADFADREAIISNLRDDFEKMRKTISDDAKVWENWNEQLLVMSSDSMTNLQRDAFILAARTELRKIRQSVTLQNGTTFTLGSRESELRLDLQNSSDFAMTVQVKVLSSKLRIDNDSTTIEVPANGSNELVIDVVALSNGLFPVEVRIFTADGLSQLGRKVDVSARVNALAGLGQIVTGVALLVLATWWVAHIRRKFRKKISKNHPVLRSSS